MTLTKGGCVSQNLRVKKDCPWPLILGLAKGASSVLSEWEERSHVAPGTKEASSSKHLLYHHLSTAPKLSSKHETKLTCTPWPSIYCLSQFLLFSQSSLHPVCSPLSYECMTEVPGETSVSRFWETKQKASIGSLSVFKHCFLPASAKLNAHFFF